MNIQPTPMQSGIKNGQSLPGSHAAGTAGAAGDKKWTVLLYSGGDNNLDYDCIQDVIDLEKVGSDKNTNVLVQIDRGENPSEISGGWKGCRRFLIGKDNNPSAIDSPVLEDLGQVNMADPKVLTDSIVWAAKSYPSEHFFLIMADHGGGWPGAMEDDSHKGWMKTGEIRSAIEEAEKQVGKKIDIVGFDACLMASSEVGYELRDCADFMIASEETEGVDGWPYINIFSGKILKSLQRALTAKLDISPDEVAKKVVKEAEGYPDTLPTLSAIELSKMSALARATDRFAEKLIATDTPPETIRSMISSTETFEGFKDQYDFAERIAGNPGVKDEALRQAAREMMNSVRDAVIAEQHAKERTGAHGLHIELPDGSSAPPGDDYKELGLSKDTKWDEALMKLSRQASENK
ncbi:MAG: clostripain-related cysteine peptidase [Candidatus Eremiobacteraeota bacterium]|nr:clostripain-related cysteine peptidase [Candidatus Eremiobacteraeota bacterium]